MLLLYIFIIVLIFSLRRKDWSTILSLLFLFLTFVGFIGEEILGERLFLSLRPGVQGFYSDAGARLVFYRICIVSLISFCIPAIELPIRRLERKELSRTLIWVILLALLLFKLWLAPKGSLLSGGTYTDLRETGVLNENRSLQFLNYAISIVFAFFLYELKLSEFSTNIGLVLFLLSTELIFGERTSIGLLLIVTLRYLQRNGLNLKILSLVLLAFVAMFMFSFARDGELDRLEEFDGFLILFSNVGTWLGSTYSIMAVASDEVVLQGNLLLTYLFGLVPGLIADLFGISRNINDANYEISEYIFGRWTQGGLSPISEGFYVFGFFGVFLSIYCFRLLSNSLSKHIANRQSPTIIGFFIAFPRYWWYGSFTFVKLLLLALIIEICLIVFYRLFS